MKVLNTSILRIDYDPWLSSFNIDCKSDCKKVSNKLNKRAHQNESTVNPLKKFEAIKIIQALITNKNKPKVISVAGSVKNINKGLKKAFNKPITNATHIA